VRVAGAAPAHSPFHSSTYIYGVMRVLKYSEHSGLLAFLGQKTKEIIYSFRALKCIILFIPSITTSFV
jgi:ABC-type sulfate transport system permease subunit